MKQKSRRMTTVLDFCDVEITNHLSDHVTLEVRMLCFVGMEVLTLCFVAVDLLSDHVTLEVRM